MLIAYWAAKGGSGATVLSAAHALRAAAGSPTLLVDLDGDLPGALGTPEPDAGVAEWLAAGASVPADALDRIARPVGPNLQLIGRGDGPLDADRAVVLAEVLARSPHTVIVDCGSRPGAAARAVARRAERSILVTRACYLAVRRFASVDLAPTEIALVREPQRALGPDDMAEAIGAPVRTRVSIDPGVARAVDSGLLASRMPRALVRAFGPARGRLAS
ncbi:hypothetical protein [Actinospongicola halichondriae]|uniref:hypothetical protein n=1 Tax=Actinospongicola halichondriae TaxID=3236844 RepID=UPI003D38FE14